MKRGRGYTLIELLLVIAILGLILALSLPDYSRESDTRSLEESARRLRSLIVMTHARAMLDGRRYRISFPGTPDPMDPNSDEDVEVAAVTEQPIVTRESDPLNQPGVFNTFAWEWLEQDILLEGTRCVAVEGGRPSFELNAQSPISGPQVTEGSKAEFVTLTFNPDGTCDWVTFVLTDLPVDVELRPGHAVRILNVIVDGRTGDSWFQRALRTDEVELMMEKGASPILHQDFTSGQQITEDNILQVHMNRGGGVGAGRRRSGS